jgi:predicted phosphodiesterase
MRVAVLSDIHANLVALDAVLAAAGPVDAVWHLGDVVGYGPEPDAVVARLTEAGAIGVAGNHDRAAVGELDVESFNPDARAAIEWTRTRISATTRSWLRALPERRTEAGLTLVHGSLRDPIWEYILSLATARANLQVLDTAIGLFGHTHLPMAWSEGDGRIDPIFPGPGSTFRFAGQRALVNPGSVGQPRDGDSRASWLELDPSAGVATWRRVTYDIGLVQAAIRDVGLPGRLADRLAHGH